MRKKRGKTTAPTKAKTTKTKASKRPTAVKHRAFRATPAAKPARAKKLTAQLPLATSRRAIFIDAENTSGEADLERVIEHLKIDRRAQPTTLIAVGNWRAIGSGAARLLARSGAELVHSAPSPGVRDWSDLWIAVAAGRWLAQAQPGDRLEIVSDDRAFDAVTQAAVAVGAEFIRISYRSIPGVTVVHTPQAVEHDRRPRRRGGRRRRHGSGGRAEGAAPTPDEGTAAEAPTSPPAQAPASEPVDGHPASHEQVRSTLLRITSGEAGRWINLDLLANALRDEGFTRPPGSPRLVTRLRHMKDIEISPNGMVRVVGDSAAASSPTEAPQHAPEPETESADATADEAAARPRRRRRRGRGGTKRKAAAAGEAPEAEPE
ncbi:MAG: NYN domain-containing protein [Deltaproteobacteria bacterium]|nr:NYN domain-containing protein [Deltaproteobacteria bacterium]